MPAAFFATLRRGVWAGLVLLLGACEVPANTAAHSSPPAQTAPHTPARTGSSRDPHGGLPYVQRGDLPPEAVTLLTAIRRGGPFRYAKDGAVFGNREGRLPRQARGYYREYTVPTPGERDRGARRIVCGGQPVTRTDECYYTADHYASFRRIQP